MKARLFNVVGLNFPKCYPVPEGTANTTENRINIQHISEKLEKGQESIEWGLIKINEKQFN